jgi:hypothetical protein
MNAVRETYVTALREDVCTICACYAPDPNFRHACIHETSGNCVVFAHLDATADLVARFRESDLPALDNVFQMHVCTQCAHADVEGICSLRDRSKPVPEWCVADAYLPQIIGAIERVQSVEV